MDPIDPLPGPLFQWRDPVGFQWNRYDLPIRDLPLGLAGFRIVHVSDTHCTADGQRAVDTLHDALAADPPELLVFTGDLFDDKGPPRRRATAVARRLAAGLVARLGSFAVLGNHDAGFALRPIRVPPLTYIDGQRRLLAGAGRMPVELIGLPGPQREDFSPALLASLPPRTPGVPRLVIGHYPDHVRRIAPLDADVYFTGHTHGGQVCMPWVRRPWRLPILRHDALPWRCWDGVHRSGDTWLVANRGFGFSALPVRMFCPAEVVEVRLIRAAS